MLPKIQMSPSKSSINTQEVEKFSKIADEWWDETGKFKPLHVINPIRLKFISEQIPAKSNILDVGCGGGLVSIPLSNQGHNVHGIDASEKNVKVAALQAKRTNSKANFEHITVEELVTKKKQFDVVLALEVVEHVDNYPEFLQNCMKLLKPGGILIVSTINRTGKSLLTAKFGAEYILRWLPVGTHDWSKFLKPEEIEHALGKPANNRMGMAFNPLSWNWHLTPNDLSVNYFLCFRNA